VLYAEVPFDEVEGPAHLGKLHSMFMPYGMKNMGLNHVYERQQYDGAGLRGLNQRTKLSRPVERDIFPPHNPGLQRGRRKPQVVCSL